MTEESLTKGDEELRIPEFATRARARRYFILAGLLLAGASVVWYYQRPKPAAEIFRTVTATKRTIVQQVEAAGRLDVRRRVEVPAPLAGRLLSIEVREGDVVTEGQALARLDQRASEVAVRSAEATAQAAAGSVAEARATLEAAQRAYERAKSLLERGFGSQEEVLRAESEVARAKAVAESARAEQRVANQRVASAQLEKSLGYIAAPSAGVILRAPERVGAAVGPEQGPLFVIGDPLDTMRVDASVSETDVPSVKPGMPAEVVVVALPGRTFKATVEHISIEPKVEAGAVLYPVRLVVDNPDRALLPGMSARVRVEVARKTDVLAVHEAALRFVPDGADPAKPRSRVWKRLGPDQAEPVQVEPGISDGTYTEITPTNGTLAEGTQVIVGYTQVDVASRGPAVKLGGKK